MASLRILLALLIALSLPAQALAGMRLTADCCPSAEASETSSEHDCCHAHDAGASGHVCDADSGCHCSGSHVALALHLVLPVAREGENAPARFLTQPHPAPPDPHWRPPAPRTTVT